MKQAGGQDRNEGPLLWGGLSAEGRLLSGCPGPQGRHSPDTLGMSPGGWGCVAVWPVIAIVAAAITELCVQRYPFSGQDWGCELTGLALVTSSSVAELGHLPGLWPRWPPGLKGGKEGSQRPPPPAQGEAGSTWQPQLQPSICGRCKRLYHH